MFFNKDLINSIKTGEPSNLIPYKSVRLTTHKPTDDEVYMHQLDMRLRGLSGLEPIFCETYKRRVQK